MGEEVDLTVRAAGVGLEGERVRAIEDSSEASPCPAPSPARDAFTASSAASASRQTAIAAAGGLMISLNPAVRVSPLPFPAPYTR